jgi:tRNA(Phe) wybutosine-synthesizing methylase Tyw3
MNFQEIEDALNDSGFKIKTIPAGLVGSMSSVELEKTQYQFVDTELVEFIVNNLNDMICGGETFLYDIYERMKKEKPELFDDKGYLRLDAR